MKKRMLAVLLALAMAAALLPAVALANDTGSGTAADPFTTVKAYNNAIYSSSSKTWNLNWCGKDIYLIINGGEFYQGDFNLRNTQSLANPPQLHLIIRNARFTGNTAGDGDMTGKGNPSFMYLANCKSLVIDNCIFDTGTSGLKYGINWNLCGIQNATVSITNCTFTGTFTKNALKLNQRNGSDDAAGDVKGDQNATWTWQGDYWIKDDGITRVYPSTIASATIANCTFSGNNAVIALGTQGKGQSGAKTLSSGAFPLTISNVSDDQNGPVSVVLDYQAALGVIPRTLTVAPGETLTKSVYGDPVVRQNSSEPVPADLVVTRQADGTSAPVQVQITLGRKLTGSYGGHYFDHGVGVLTMQPGQSLYIHDLPANMTYEIAVLDGLVTSEHNITGTTLPGVYTYADFAALPGVTPPDVVPGEEEIVEGEEEIIDPGEEAGDVQEGTEETPPEETVPEEGLEELPEEGEVPTEEEPVDVPKTGDVIPSIGLALVLGLAACAVVLKKARAK